ncbi:MAG TPA: methyltransferase domain-containing protein [Bauldia sp.]|nr:methyltransferase domain-containing protein [Bauldia sp.]
MTDGPPQIFDRPLLDRRRRRAMRASADGADFLRRAVADDLLDRLAAVNRRFALAAEIGSPDGLVAARLVGSGQVDRLVRLDRLAETPPGPAHAVAGDEEAPPFAPASLDLAVSVLALHLVNDLPGALLQVRQALKPDGLFLAALLGGDTLHELRTAFTEAELELAGGASPRVAPFAEIRALGALLQRAGFALPVVDQDRLVIRYDDAFALMRDLRAMGAASVLVERPRTPLRRAVLLRMAEIYAARFSDPDGRIRATFDVVSLSGWAPDPGQQKPLRPGSAAMRLADALGAREEPLPGEPEKDGQP